MKAKIRGTEIYFDIAGMQFAPHGQGFVERPVLFLLHGGPGGDHLRFKQHSLELQDAAQLVFIDHRGCGRSKKTKMQEYTLKNNVEDIEALRKHLGLDSICLLGTSYGGMVAQAYAVRYPQHLDKLILVATAPSKEFLHEAKKYIAEHGSLKQIAMCEVLWKGQFKNHKHVMKFFELMESVYSTTAKKNSKKLYSKSNTIWSHEALNYAFGGFLRHYNVIDRLKNIRCPTLILAGENDWICSLNQAKTIANNIHASKLKIFKNCGHAVAVDAHDAYINMIKKFLKL